MAISPLRKGKSGADGPGIRRARSGIDRCLRRLFVGARGGGRPYIAIAAGLGVGEDNLDKAEIIEFNPEAKSAQPFRLSRRVQSLARYIEECEACSCYGSLIHALHRLERKVN